MLRAVIRCVFSQIRALPLMDRLHFHLSALFYRRRNLSFLAARPDFTLPPARLLHETYRLDYSAYAVDGEETAKELFERCRPFLTRVPADVLEWGCGVARLTRHLAMLPDVGTLTGADVNAEMISWNRRHIKGVVFFDVDHEPPMAFSAESFNLVLAVSVLTHIPGNRHEFWLEEIRRILRPGGILLFTTQGRAFRSKLSHREKQNLEKDGYLTRDYPQRGHRMMSTFQNPAHVSGLLSGRFEMLSFTDGAEDRAAAGGQDLWLVRGQA